MPSSNLTKFNLFTQDLARGKHVLDGSAGTYKVFLTNTLPVVTNHLYADISGNEIANGNGYTTGGAAATMSDSSASGVETVSATSETWTGSGTGFGPFRYAVLYRSDSVGKEMIGWLDYGSAISIGSGEQFVVQFPSGVLTVT